LTGGLRSSVLRTELAADERDLRSYPTSINTAAFERDRWVIGIGAASKN
jgi:hypothetical protein